MTRPLDERIAATLAADCTLTADELDDLIKEVEDAHAECTDVAEHARVRALDPSNADPGPDRSEMEAAAFRAERLNVAYPRLKAQRDRKHAEEQAAAWEKRCRKVEARRDEMVAELTTVYPQLAAELADLFGRITKLDQEVSRINGEEPYSEHRRLLGVEATATGAVPSIINAVGLPAWQAGQQPYWPPPPPPIDPALFAPMPFDRRYSGDWWQVKEEEAQERRREAERVAAHYEQQARQQEERENIEEANSRRAAR